jgi:hypothetical protein
MEAGMTTVPVRNIAAELHTRIGGVMLAAILTLGCGDLSSLSAQATPGRSPIILTGQIVDEKSGNAMRGAIVDVQPARRQVIADSDGRFQLRLRPGDYVVTASLLGFGAQQRVISLVPGEQEPLIFRLEPEPQVLERITVIANRLERRRRAIPVASRVWTRDQLRTAVNLDQFFRGGAMITRVGCPQRSASFILGDQDCIYRRGQAVAPRLFIDDRPAFGGFSELAMYSPVEVNRMEVYGGGTMIRMYTDHYVESVARSKGQLLPVIWW